MFSRRPSAWPHHSLNCWSNLWCCHSESLRSFPSICTLCIVTLLYIYMILWTIVCIASRLSLTSQSLVIFYTTSENLLHTFRWIFDFYDKLQNVLRVVMRHNKNIMYPPFSYSEGRTLLLGLTVYYFQQQYQKPHHLYLLWQELLPESSHNLRWEKN